MFHYKNLRYKNPNTLYKAILKDADGWIEPTAKQLKSFSVKFLKENKFLFVIKESLKDNVKISTYSNGATVTVNVLDIKLEKCVLICKQVFPSVEEKHIECGIVQGGVAIVRAVGEHLTHSVIYSDKTILAQTTQNDDTKINITHLMLDANQINNISSILKK